MEKKFRQLVERYAFDRFPHFILLWGRVRVYEEPGKTQTMAITDGGRLIYNPKFVEELGDEELAGVIFHELMHVLLSHGTRKIQLSKQLGGIDDRLWAFAIDAVVNDYLLQNQVTLPVPHITLDRVKDVLTAKNTPVPADLTAEALYVALLAAQPPPDTTSGGAGDGCAPEPPESPESPEAEADLEFQEHAEAVRQLMPDLLATLKVTAPLPPVSQALPFRVVLDAAYSRAVRDAQGTTPTYSAIRRRDMSGSKLRLPAWRGYSVSVGVIVDVSGSMHESWVAQIYATIRALTKKYGTKTWLASHTNQLVWEGWVDAKTDFSEALVVGGWTNPDPAYAAIPKGLNILIHFTDTVFGDSRSWPTFPRNLPLLIARYGYAPNLANLTQPPKQARVVDVLLA